MFFTISLYIALGIGALGLVYRILNWFLTQRVPGADKTSFGLRVFGTLRAIGQTVLSPRILLLPLVLVFDVFLQRRILKTSVWRWIAHMLIFSGFVLLTALHAMDELITDKLFPEYFSTLHPFFFLRNLFGVMVLLGVLLAAIRRIRGRGTALKTRFGDGYAIVIVAVILVTGFFLDSAKIISERVFDRMVEDYFDSEEDDDLPALKTCWAEDYHVVFADPSPLQAKLLEKGRELNENYCSSCHSSPKTAFASFALSQALRPSAGILSKSRADVWLYWIHVLACFLGLAYLPFSKFFHLISDPIVMTIGGLQKKRIAPDLGPTPGPEIGSAVTRRAVELDACINCGACSRVCSVAPVARVLGNETVLPSEKLHNIKSLSRDSLGGENLARRRELHRSSEGAYICTQCFKCTEVCPVSINLQDQWAAQRALLASRGFGPPGVWIKENSADHWARVLKKLEDPGTSPRSSSKKLREQLSQSDRFAACIQCQTCTNVCPVVAAVSGESSAVDITPQKVMNLLRMGLKDLAGGSRMVWDCATCYQCQENCPQGIHVTELMLELRNMTYERLREGQHRDTNRDIPTKEGE